MIRNKTTKKWIDSSVFREEAIKFRRNKAFCAAPPETPDWFTYWEEQLDRCENGYEVGGERITGHHYFYLNFTEIQIVQVVKGSTATSKITQQPDFWDGDYEYFWSLEIAKNGLFNKTSQVQTSPEEKEDYHNYQDILDRLKKELGKKYYDNAEYIETKRLRDQLSLTVLDRIGLRVRPHLDYLNGGQHMIVGKSRRKGYQLPHSEVVMTPFGKKTMGDIKVDDTVSTPVGEAKVLEIFPQGIDEVYKITLYDGREVKCGKEHLWKIYSQSFRKDYRQEKVVQTDFLLGEELKTKKGYKWYLPINEEVVNKNIKELPIPSYTLGCILGDGNVTKQLNLNCKSEYKYIPDVYKYHSTLEQRLKLVKGLMDTDGTISEDGASSFCNKSKQLVEDLQEVLYSLGITSTFRKRKDGMYIIYINTDKNIFSLDRKVSKIKVKSCRKFIPITKVEKLDYKEESSCFLLDSDEHLFLTNKYVVTHNSYKNGAIASNVYNTVRNAQIIIGAFEKKFLFPKGTMGMASDYINFLNEYTGWSKSRDYVDKQDHRRASYKSTTNGTTTEKGYKSEVFALSFRDNPNAARGKDGKIVLLEEAGAFPNLKDSFAAIKPALTAGAYITGQIIIFGTGGDMEGGTIDYADMFYNPEIYGLLPFVNIWDENAENTTCGFFHPVSWNMEGFYDEQGNSDIEGATIFEEDRRVNILEKASSSTALQLHVQEFPFCPAEAFLTVSTNNFPVVELRNQLNKVTHEKLQLKKGTPVNLVREDGVVKAKPDLENKLEPILNYRPKVDDLSGAVMIYEYPIDNPPKGLYKIGYDPYRQDLSSGVSLAAVYVYKSTHRGSYKRNMIVAEYIGRPPEADDVNRICSYLSDLYNAEVMHENEVTHVKNYFRRHNLLRQLAVQPDAVISKNVKHSTVARVYGIHMNVQLKDAGEKYIKDWLLTISDYDENGNPILNLETIYSIGLLEELIQYNRKGNFDRCVAKGTKITCIEGVKNIEDVKIGEQVLTVDGSLQEVDKVDRHVHKKNIELNIVGQADNLIVTDNHPLLIASTNLKKHSCRLKALDNIVYKRADELTDKYQFCLLPKRNKLSKNNYEDDILYLIGWVLGDGYVNSKNNSISICLQYDQEDIADRLIAIINTFTENEELTKQKSFLRNGKIIETKREYKNTKTRKLKKEGYIRITKTSKKLSKLLLSVGCTPNSKQITKDLYETSNLMPLVVGLLEADGHQKFNSIEKYKRCNIEIATVYTNLLLQVRQILIDNNIWSSISNVIREGSTTQLRLNIPTNYINKTLSFYKSLKFIACDFKGRKEIQIVTEAGFWTPISIINSVENQEVYNMSIKNNHTYVANGVVSHNCMSFMMCMFQLQEDELGKEFVDNANKNAEDILQFMNKISKRN